MMRRSSSSASTASGGSRSTRWRLGAFVLAAGYIAGCHSGSDPSAGNAPPDGGAGQNLGQSNDSSDSAVDAGSHDAAAADAGIPSASCPEVALFKTANGLPCAMPTKQCFGPECANACVECTVLVCQQKPGSDDWRWELNSMEACRCGAAPPACFDQQTCVKDAACN